MSTPTEETIGNSWPKFFRDIPVYIALLFLLAITWVSLKLPQPNHFPFGFLGGALFFGGAAKALNQPWRRRFAVSVFSALVGAVAYVLIVEEKHWSLGWYFASIAAAVSACWLRILIWKKRADTLTPSPSGSSAPAPDSPK